MYNLVLVQARMGSSRLPNKVLMDICGKPVIQRVIERVQRSRCIDEVILLTSVNIENLPLVRFCADLGIRVFVGSENDVLDRYYQAARLLKPDNIIRVTGDCPVFDWRFLDQAISSFDLNSDYLWLGEDGFPDGLDLEIFRFHALERAWNGAKLQSEREHVTPYFRNHPELFNIQIFDFPIKNSGLFRWTLDEAEDYELISRIYEYFIHIGNEFFATEDIIAFLKEHPEISQINNMYIRNEGLLKSLREDRLVEGLDNYGI